MVEIYSLSAVADEIKEVTDVTQVDTNTLNDAELLESMSHPDSL